MFINSTSSIRKCWFRVCFLTQTCTHGRGSAVYARNILSKWGDTKQTRSDRWVNGVIGDSPQSGLQGAFHEWSQQEKSLQIVPDGTLGVAVMFYRTTIQQTRLVEQDRTWKRETFSFYWLKMSLSRIYRGGYQPNSDGVHKKCNNHKELKRAQLTLCVWENFKCPWGFLMKIWRVIFVTYIRLVTILIWGRVPCHEKPSMV